VEAATVPRYSSGRLLFVRSGKIMAQPFDPNSFKLSGDPQTLGEASRYSISRDGVLVYHESSSQSELKIFDRSGNVISTPGPLAVYYAPRFSPDGKSISVAIRDPKTTKRDIWIFPITGGQPVRATFGPEDYSAVWSPDGKSIAYGVREQNVLSIRRRSLDGSTPEQTLFKSDTVLFAVPIDWSPDGKYLSADLMAKDTGVYANWIIPLDGSAQPFRPPLTATLTAAAYEGRFSPDGHWLSYFSYESGRPEAYVIPFPAQGAKYQATTTGGWLPRFAGTNDFLFLTMANRLMTGRVATQPNFHLEDVHALFQLDLPNTAGINMDISRDGQRLAVLNTDRTKTSSITLLTNWPAAIKQQ
jgi:Tol biopolymer transport system component